jgi:predicted nuclease of predicted toxin-antitoxin system
MGISKSVSAWLKAIGHDAVHLNDENLHTLPDNAILQKAIAENRIILTSDTDFGKLLAFSKSQQASVIQFRTTSFTPDNVRSKLELVFSDFSGALDKEFIITIEDDRIRYRTLPI